MQNTDPRLERLLFNLDALAELGEELTSQKDFNRVIKSSLYMIIGTFSASKGAMFQFDHEQKIVHPIASKGIVNINDMTMKLKEETVEEIISLKTPIDIKNNDKVALLIGMGKADLEKLKARILIPLVVREDFLGLIFIGEKFSREAYTKDDIRLLSVIAHNIAVTLHSYSLLKKLMHKYDENKKLYENLSHIYYDTIHAFATAIDAKDAYTKGHSHRVSAYCAAIASEMTWSHKELEGIRIAGLLHDIGKIAIDKSIINKDNPLTKNEFIELNSHPVIGYEILSRVKFPWTEIAKISRCHHERVDGKGYPDGLKGNKIPCGVKIMTLADSFDAMSTDRPYRPALSASEVLIQLKENCGKQFDKDVLQSFFSIIRKEVYGENRPAILPLLRDSFAYQLKSEVLNGSINSFNPSKSRRKRVANHTIV
ncbi:MAG: HD domain-containing protein [Deltaproteobacteria bacterium]|nr:HD domain-containing protein [Deltaproteobacteria bacterium]